MLMTAGKTSDRCCSPR